MDNSAWGGVSAIGVSFVESINADFAQDNNHTEVISISSEAAKGGSEGKPAPLANSPNSSEAQIASSTDIAEGGTELDITGWSGDYDLPR
jgi:hypothetical protein